MDSHKDVVDPGEPRIDWDDPEMVRREVDRVFKTFPHMDECAAADGWKCPLCGSSEVDVVRRGSTTPRHFKTFHCQDCGSGFTRYEVDPEHEDKWGPLWHTSVVSFQIEGYSHYVYYAPGTHVFQGIGPGVFPWSQ